MSGGLEAELAVFAAEQDALLQGPVYGPRLEALYARLRAEGASLEEVRAAASEISLLLVVAASVVNARRRREGRPTVGVVGGDAAVDTALRAGSRSERLRALEEEAAAAEARGDGSASRVVASRMGRLIDEAVAEARAQAATED